MSKTKFMTAFTAATVLFLSSLALAASTPPTTVKRPEIAKSNSLPEKPASTIEKLKNTIPPKNEDDRPNPKQPITPPKSK